MQPDAVPATEIVPIFCGIINPNAIPIAGCGAADAQAVGLHSSTQHHKKRWLFRVSRGKHACFRPSLAH
jgi:hypothetical protein